MTHTDLPDVPSVTLLGDGALSTALGTDAAPDPAAATTQADVDLNFASTFIVAA